MFKYAWAMRFFLNLWPPFLFAGISVKSVSKDFSCAKVCLTLRPWNKNGIGVHFGGSLFAMTDPFYMLMIFSRLGKGYYVWDKSAEIDYIKPGRGKVFAHIEVSDELISTIKEKTAKGEKYLPQLPITLVDEKGETVAQLTRTIYIKKKLNK